MNNIEIIDYLIHEAQSLKLYEETKLDALKRKAEMVIRNINIFKELYQKFDLDI